MILLTVKRGHGKRKLHSNVILYFFQ
jgi:hypothetical protein